MRNQAAGQQIASRWNVVASLIPEIWKMQERGMRRDQNNRECDEPRRRPQPSELGMVGQISARGRERQSGDRA